MANESSAVGKLILYGALGVGAIIAIYFAVTKLVTGGGQAFLDQYNKSLETYVNKMNGYANQNNGVLNQAQQQSKDFEEKQLSGLAANAASAFNGVWNWLAGFIVTGAIAAFLYGVFKNPATVDKWKSIFNNSATQPKSPKAQCVMLDCALVDELNAEGFAVEASNFLASIQSTWQTIDAPYMQEQITILLNQINAGILTGIELELATYFVQAYTFELTMIPVVLALPLVP